MVVRVLLPEYSLVKVVLVVVEVVCLLYIIISLLYLNSIELNCSNLCIQIQTFVYLATIFYFIVGYG